MIHLKKPQPVPRSVNQEIRETVSRVLLEVERDGISAVRKYSEQFDGWNPPNFCLTEAQIKRGLEGVTDQFAQSIDFAIDQVRAFARAQRATMHELELETLPGVTLGHKLIPVNSVGAYVPGGRYPLIASAIMTIAVPKIAGVGRVVTTTPPQRGSGEINPAQLYAMVKSGADQIYAIGGVQAMAAMAFGLESDGEMAGSVPTGSALTGSALSGSALSRSALSRSALSRSDGLTGVDMIVGAGNAFVAEAKRQLFGVVGIDLLAGPTEVCVLADQHADPRLIAADLLGQAEHGTNSPAVLITTSRDLGEAVIKEVDRWLQTWPTAAVAGEAWRNLGEVILVEDDREMLRVSDQIASEHLEVQTRDPNWFLERLTNYGSLFLGRNATVVYGDKGIGTNHVLPTARASRYTGGLWVGKFIKTVTYQRVTDAGNRLVAPHIATVAEAEGMAGHAITARLRLDDRN